ncbi:cell division protein DivIC [Weissella uvarum]|uniref:FtsB family cell division protein n=1 Tax=Weissella uvarum TaxID=1479233 RepID=UPI00195FC1B9|nr:septum formation initiator family protein [Weissella uvarum]MBM7618066.1 cell division protein DivIC [Weissella uvarum]MCM0595077.1 septum formation initiator family protein [Weissella uvarum]
MAKYQNNKNIQPLNDAGQRSLEFKKQEQIHQHKVHRRRRLICAAMICVLTLTFAWQYQAHSARYNQTVQASNKMQKKLDSAKATNKQLKQTRRDVKDDTYLSKLARDRYLYSKKGEVVFNLPDN